MAGIGVASFERASAPVEVCTRIDRDRRSSRLVDFIYTLGLNFFRNPDGLYHTESISDG